MYEQGLYNCRMAEAWKKRARDAADALDLTADFLAEENAKAGLAMGGTIEGIRNDAAKARRAPTESDGTGEI